MKKKNPRNQPLTRADYNKMRKLVSMQTVQDSLVIFFSALADKEGMEEEDLKRIYLEIEDLSQSIREGYINISDLRRVLLEEKGMRFATFYSDRWR